MIEVENISKRYGAHLAVDSVSFSVERGEILGLLGTNGAGKTTLMRILACVFPPTSGVARVAGFDVRSEPMEARRRVGYMPETVPLYLEMRVRDFLSFVAGVKGLTGVDRDADVESVLDDCDLKNVDKRIIGNLSRGFRQRVGLAQAIVGAPEIVILDEPTVGLDPSQVVEFRDLIRSLAGRQTVILSTHILPEVNVTCGRVVIIHQGKVVAWGAPHHLQTRFAQVAQLEVTVDGVSVEQAQRKLLGVDGVHEVIQVRPRGGGMQLILRADPGRGPDVARLAVGEGWLLLDMRELGATLEDVFMQATSSAVERAT
jgi:ABC-2 type transport system ATP-binding protein